MKVNKDIKKEMDNLLNIHDGNDPSFSQFIDLIDNPTDEMVNVNLRLNREVVDFFKEHSKKYQVKINEALLMLVRHYKQHKKH